MNNIAYLPLWLAIVACVSSLGAAYLSYLSQGASTKTSNKVDEHQESVTKKIDVLTKQTDGLTTALVNATGKIAFQKGVVKGTEDEKAKSENGNGEVK